MILLLLTLALAAPPDVATLVNSVVAHADAESSKARKYTWREEVTHRQFDKKGKEDPPRTETFDVLFLEGSLYHKLILENGKPLAPKKQAKVDEDLDKERTLRKGRPRSTLTHRIVYLGGIELIPKLFNATITADSLDGRAVWKLDATPRTDVKPQKEEERAALGSKQTLWIDREESAVVRSRMEFLVAQKGMQPGTVWTQNFAKVNGDCWLPLDSHFESEFTPVKFIRVRLITDKRFSDYKKFDVGSSIEYESPR